MYICHNIVYCCHSRALNITISNHCKLLILITTLKQNNPPFQFQLQAFINTKGQVETHVFKYKETNGKTFNQGVKNNINAQINE